MPTPAAASSTTASPVSVEEHLARILGVIETLAVVEVVVEDALGLVTAVDVVSPVSLPRFDNSAMDGYAVRVDDLVGAHAESPVVLPVIGAIGAGQGGVSEVPAGAVAKIMTGAPMPPGADAVVPYEWTDHGTERVQIRQAPTSGQHVRPAGEDVAAGDLLITAGTRLTARHVGLLASVGHASVEVRRRPRVLVCSTGSELRAPGEELAPDSIYDGNSYLLAATLTQMGAEPVRVGIVPDSAEQFVQMLQEHLDSVDAVVTSGGVSMGDYDIVKSALLEEERMWFGPVAMQPGKPQGFGLLGGPGEGATPIFTLPGNPVSSYISTELFVRPALRQMIGRDPIVRPELTALLTEGVRSPAARRQFLRGNYTPGTATKPAQVRPAGGAGSHLVGDLSRADCLIVVPERATEVAAGEPVQVVVLDTDD